MNNKLNTAFLGIITIIALGAVFHSLSSFFLPLIIALICSFILIPLMNFFVKWHLPRFLSILIVMSMFLTFIYIAGRFFYKSINSFIPVFPDYSARLLHIIELFWLKYNLPPKLLADFNWMQTITNYIFSWSGSFVDFIKSLIIVVLILFFIMLEYNWFTRKLMRAYPKRTSLKVLRIVFDINQQVARYMSVKFLVSLGTGVLVYFCLSFIGMDFALLWGVIALLLNFIPNIGSTFVMIITILMGLIQFYPEWNKVLFVVISMVGVQTVMGNFIDPLFQGDQLDLSPLVILVSLIFWGWLWGITGMFLSSPLMVTIKIICAHFQPLKPISILMGSGKPQSINLSFFLKPSKKRE